MERQAEVDVGHHGKRLDRVAAALFPEFSRARLQAWIKDGQLTLRGLSARPRDPVEAGDVLELRTTLSTQTAWAAQELPLAVVYEDEHVIVVNKTANCVVHPGAGNTQGTLANALLAHRPELRTLPRGGIVHRLDKDTTGLLVVAASTLAQRSLVEQLQDRSVHREYLALVRGVPTGPDRIDVPIGRHPRQRTKMAALPAGGGARPAITNYRIKQSLGPYTLLSVMLETGRTHQIRVHLAHKGMPLVGDPLYGGRLQIPRGVSVTAVDALRDFKRQALHAIGLSFAHPQTHETVSFAAPLASDFADLLAALNDSPVE
ncbi:MAG: RluA family pseudouridine synthase [Pseudomonadota bacterium]